jgi:hypothetical protein
MRSDSFPCFSLRGVSDEVVELVVDAVIMIRDVEMIVGNVTRHMDKSADGSSGPDPDIGRTSVIDGKVRM